MPRLQLFALVPGVLVACAEEPVPGGAKPAGGSEADPPTVEDMAPLTVPASCPWPLVEVAASQPVTVDWSAVEVDVLGKPLSQVPPLGGNVSLVTYHDIDAPAVLDACGQVEPANIEVQVVFAAEDALSGTIPLDQMPAIGDVVMVQLACDGRLVGNVFLAPTTMATSSRLEFP